MAIICPSCNSGDILCTGAIPRSNWSSEMQTDTIILQGELFRCKICSLYFRWPRPDREQLKKVYDKFNLDVWAYNRFRKDWEIAASWINKKFNKGSILDVGCWVGEFLGYLNENWKLYGIEVNSAAVNKATSKGVNIIGKDFRDIKSLNLEFDVTTAFDFIEHVEDPSELICLMAQVTKRGGYIIIASGNTEAPTWKICKSKYWYCTIPEHISFINSAWCRFIGDKFNLEIESIERFCHADNRFFDFFLDSLKNGVYLAIPGLVAWLRKIRKYKLMRKNAGVLFDSPPSWRSSKDHLIVVYRRK